MMMERIPSLLIVGIFIPNEKRSCSDHALAFIPWHTVLILTKCNNFSKFRVQNTGITD